MVNAVNLNPTFGAKQYEFSSKPPKDKPKNYLWKNRVMWIVVIIVIGYQIELPSAVQQEIQYEKVVPLSLTDRIHSRFIEYSPCSHYKGEFKVDLEEEEFNFSFLKVVRYIYVI